jgi:hypothetical protein
MIPEIETVSHEELHPADWRATHTLKPDLRLVSDSIMNHGWLLPVIVMQDGTIIDGFHRWVLAHRHRPIFRKYKGKVPVVRKDVDSIDARLLHVQLNRGHGDIVPKYLSLLIKDVLRSGKYTEEDLKKELRMGVDELALLMDGTLLKQRNIKEYEYSKAWEPADSDIAQAPELERPPGADR